MSVKMIELSDQEKAAVLAYLNHGEVVAVAAGYPRDHKTGVLLKADYLAYTDGVYDWTTEDIINFDRNDEIFNEALIKKRWVYG